MKLAAIDIGSNAIRLAISRVLPHPNNEVEFKKVEFIRIPLRLGNDVFRKGKIGKEKQRLFLMTMQAFKLIMDIHNVKHYRACATSALREAKNGKELLDKVKKKYDFDISIISGYEESQLILKSVYNIFPDKGDFLNIDVGGGSTEITIVHDHQPVNSKSFDVGAVRSKEGYIKQEAWAEMEAWVKSQTNNLKYPTAFGTGGNINRLCRMIGIPEGSPAGINELIQINDKIKMTPIHERIYDMQMNPDRADVIDHAGNIYIKVMQWAGIQRIIAPNVGLKDGLLIELWDEVRNTVK